ncbi:TPA: hypothetical protein JS309_004222 [Escherichia coli]|nr:hypothetical protein [Escherichia coli]
MLLYKKIVLVWDIFRFPGGPLEQRRQGDPLEVAHWLQACHDAGIEVRVQVNESVTT